MLSRLLQPPLNQNVLVFGPRGSGKSTLLKKIYDENTRLYIDLLLTDTETRFSRNPDELVNIVEALPEAITHIIIDEIQKIPKLLDIVHLLIEKKKKYFVLSGSSARKLKRGAANLLAGRAFVYHLHAFSFLELEKPLDLQQALDFGMLPKIFEIDSEEQKRQFLISYAHSYLQEEIVAEQTVRKLDPFRRFLEVAAQCSGKIVNYSNIAQDVGANEKTVQQYFEILEDTLVGFFLEPFHHSFRKRLSKKPKFYLFDVGVTRALARQLSIPVMTGTSYYGDLFEQYIILESKKLASYFKPEFRFSYLQTKDGNEVDLVVDRPGQPHLFIEIKSSTQVTQEQLTSFSKITNDFGNCEAVCFSNDPYPKQIGNITVMPWRDGIKKYFS